MVREDSSEITKTAAILPLETPDWGAKLLEIIQGEFRQVNEKLSVVTSESSKATRDLDLLSKKMETVSRMEQGTTS